MLRQWLIVVICVLCSILPVIQCKLCEDMRVMNRVSDFEQLRDCTVIVGSLRILLIEKANISDYQNISFPDLREITGFLLIFRVKGLVSLGKLFPNLSVIRGQTLIADFSFILYEVTHLQEIGLYNLRNITRGSTRIERCSNLCYVNSIDWSSIGGPKHKLVEFDNMDDTKDCRTCPEHCKGLCWNQEHCQIIETEDCDPECIGCTGGSTANYCNACKSKKDNQRCVNRCPDNKFAHMLTEYCVTEEECFSSTMLNETWWIFNEKCVNTCPPNYLRVSKEEGFCMFCGNHCRKECAGDTSPLTSAADAQKLQGCTHIKGPLSIKIDSKSTADELEKNLGMIEEIEDYLKIYRSHPLTSLEFFKKLKVIHGKSLDNKRHALVVFENQNLQKLWDWDNFSTLDIRNGTISFHYNPQLCLSEIEKLANITGSKYTNIDVSPYSNGEKTACNYIDLRVTIKKLSSTNITLEWESFMIHKGDNTMLIGYLLYYIEDPMGNITIYDERDECDTAGWNSIITSQNSQEIVNLKPFTRYAYYVKTLTSSISSGGQTEITRFTTLSDDPSIPLDVKIIKTNSNSVTLTWKPPQYPNGIISFYDIVAYNEENDIDLLSERNYCDFPQTSSPKQIETSVISETSSNSTTNSTCCSTKKRFSLETFDNLCEKIKTDSLVSSKSQVCKKYMYLGVDNTSYTEDVLDIKHKTTNETQYVMKSLRHYANYVFLLRACNADIPLQCSAPIMISRRTLKNISADDIPSGLMVEVRDYDAFISWSEPKDPNSLIVSYHVQHNRIDLQHSQVVTECITRENYTLNSYGHHLKNFPSGKYSVKVQAFSLAGGGRFSDSVEFEIYAPSSNSTLVAIIVSIIVVIIIIATPIAAYYYCMYKEKHRFANLHLITNVNPDYAGPTYIEDEWEMEREDLVVSKELGQGTFGMVYSGFIKSKNRPCAVKTINEHTNCHEKMVFLNEASVMKSFSDAHHVVKLLGVVSKGEPPFVVMELMARGDLKSFLRRSRDSSTTITCAEMYRMAAEIADGMMYLQAKKFVHRDLAARNCMVAADYTVKIGDFGMTRDIYETDYYRKESRGLMPVRWMAPESLADGVFTTDSDVWSYGIVLWEMVTLAEQPYQGLANEQVLQFVIAQGTLERPPECPDLLYEIMEVCWKWRPNSRPRFEDIVEKLEPNVGQNFRLVSFYHSSGGEEYRMNSKTRVFNPPALAVPLDRSKRIHWRTSEDDLSLYSSFESNRPTPLLSSIQHQSRNSFSDDDSYR